MPGNRIDQIDALRAIAAMLVLVTHASEVLLPMVPDGGATWLYAVSHAVDLGRVGVVVFFLASGYVIANTLRPGAAGLKAFVLRRFLRLFPLYWLSMAAAVLWWHGGLPPTAVLFGNATMLPILWGVPPLMGVYWTLETELVFYALAIGLVACGLLHRPWGLLLVIGALISLFALFMFGIVRSPDHLAWKSLPLHLGFLLLGVLVHVLRHARAAAGPWDRAVLVAAVGLVLAPSLFAGMRYWASGSPDDLRWGFSYPLAVGLFMLGLWLPPWRGLARLGVLSYSIYLVHPFALTLWQGTAGAAMVQAHGMVANVGLALLLTCALSGLTYVLVERPFIRLGRRLTQASPVAPVAPSGSARQQALYQVTD